MADKRALVIGVNTYQSGNNLRGCVPDAKAIADLLERNSDGSSNYHCRSFLDSTDDGKPLTRANVRAAIDRLFRDYRGEVLLYFSGHGVLTSTGGYLCTTDAERNDWGIPMQEVVDMAAISQAKDILMILDCCHAGDFGNPTLLKRGQNPLATIREDMTVIASSRDVQTSVERSGHGVFTKAVLDALDGGAADHMGWITAPSIYAYVERQFGGWDQRPVYKSHSTDLTIVRKCAPLIERFKLAELTKYFPSEDHKFQLDPEYEPEDENGNVKEPVNEEKRAIAVLFKEFRDAGFLKPSIPGEQLYWTARRGHTVELTHRGKEYWRLVKFKRI